MLPLIHPALTKKISLKLPDATIVSSQLPLVPEIKLYLLNNDFSNASLTDEAFYWAMHHPSYWLFCWASGQVLARWILDNADLFYHKTVVDFGCGSGIAAIAAAKAGAKRIIACDIDSDALAATAANAELNNVQLQLAEDFFTIGDSIDIITVADVLYDKVNLQLLDRVICKASETIIADSRIKNFSYPGFNKLGCFNSSTLPDLAESQEFNTVNLYHRSI